MIMIQGLAYTYDISIDILLIGVELYCLSPKILRMQHV